MMKLSEFIPPEDLPEGVGELDVSTPVAQWLLDVHRRGGWDALSQFRKIRISDGSEVLQHFAEWGDPPHPLCERVLDRFLRRNRLAQYGGL